MLDLRGLGLTFATIAITSAADRFIVNTAAGVINVMGAERGTLTAGDFLFAHEGRCGRHGAAAAHSRPAPRASFAS